MKTKLFSTMIAAGVIAISQNALASDGTITFNGNITAQTCTIASSAGGKDFTVVLPTVSTSILAAAGQTAGDTAFSINLSACSPNSGPVRTHFEAGSTVNAQGRLLQQAAGTATNVDIQLLNGDSTVIKAGDPDASQNSKPTAIASGSATLPYIGRYYATGTSTAGTVTSFVTYSLAYQ
ncbi:fimbrial protein [Cupriavidus basilensis]|uniref:Fimbrial protein n=1 Tax=Cupriavidus basilensis TaxID=68895 RepID=A0ABT6B2Q8_9BURK|nr:fimbrial protein [Cupriavidus basilensis]MDF3839161.1 fimbrial protein [Cupriavidus basilensis]